MIYILWTDITVISFEYPASLLQGWKTFPKTGNDNIIYQVHFLELWREHNPLLSAKTPAQL